MNRMRKPNPTIALFPEASFGAALNCVGIAQALRARGARPVFICHAGFTGVFADYGFQEYQLPTEDRLSDSERQSYWQAFVRRHLPHFRLSPADQLETELANLKKEQFNLRFQKATGQLENTSRVRQVRRDIARIKTIAAQKRAADQG